MSGADRRDPRHVPGSPAPSLVGNCIRRPRDHGRLTASTAVRDVRRRFLVGDELAVSTSLRGRTPCFPIDGARRARAPCRAVPSHDRPRGPEESGPRRDGRIRADPGGRGRDGADSSPLRTVRTSWGRPELGLPDRRAGSDRRRAVRGQSPRWPSASSSVGLFHADRADRSNRGRSYRLEGPTSGIHFVGGGARRACPAIISPQPVEGRRTDWG
jgi:hypothetical protein